MKNKNELEKAYTKAKLARIEINEAWSKIAIDSQKMQERLEKAWTAEAMAERALLKAILQEHYNGNYTR